MLEIKFYNRAPVSMETFGETGRGSIRLAAETGRSIY